MKNDKYLNDFHSCRKCTNTCKIIILKLFTQIHCSNKRLKSQIKFKILYLIIILLEYKLVYVYLNLKIKLLLLLLL